jgi:hypothetical protein
MAASQETGLRTYWRQLWASTEEADSQDIWYAIDEAKFGYLRRFLSSGGRSLEVGCGSARLSRFLPYSFPRFLLVLGLLYYFRDRCLTLFLLTRKSGEVGWVKSGNGTT